MNNEAFDAMAAQQVDPQGKCDQLESELLAARQQIAELQAIKAVFEQAEHDAVSFWCDAFANRVIESLVATIAYMAGLPVSEALHNAIIDRIAGLRAVDSNAPTPDVDASVFDTAVSFAMADAASDIPAF